MTKRIVVDPITRIEGHLRIEVIVDEDNETFRSENNAVITKKEFLNRGGQE